MPDSIDPIAPTPPTDLQPAEPVKLTLPDEDSDRDRNLWCALLVLMTLLAFSPAFFADFLWDDERHVVNNPLLQDFHDLQRIWVGVFEMPTYQLPQYYPLTHTGFWLQYQIWQLWPVGYHAVNVLLHAGAALLLWRVLLRLKFPVAYVAAALFALHPVAVESVVWVSELKNVLALSLGLGSLLMYLRYVDALEDETKVDEVPKWYGLSLGLFVAALLSKTIASSLPAVIILILWWQRRLARRAVAMLAPFFAIGIAAGALTSYMEENHVNAKGVLWDFSAAERVIMAGRNVWFYLSKVVAPVNLSFVYEKWSIDPASAVNWLFPAAVIAVLGMLLLLHKRIGRGPFVAAAIFVGTLIPALGFFNVYPMRYAYAADHFQYISMISLIVGGTWLGHRALSRVAPGSVVAKVIAAAVVCVVLIVLTSQRAWAFENDETLWRDTIAKNRTAPMPRSNLSRFLHQKAIALEKLAVLDDAAGRTSEADDAREQAVASRAEARALALEAKSLDDRDAAPYELLARLDQEANRIDEALFNFRKAVELEPIAHDRTESMRDIGLILESQGKLEEAMAEYAEILAIKPLAPTALHRTAILSEMFADKTVDPAQRELLYRNALGAYVKLINSRGTDDDAAINARRDFGRLCAKLIPTGQIVPDPNAAAEGRVDLMQEAISQLRVYLEVRPDDASAWNELAFLYGRMGDFLQAESYFKAALNIDKENVEAKRGLELIAMMRDESRRKAATRAATQATTQETTQPASP